MPFGERSYGSHEMRFLTVEQALADMTDLLAKKSALFACSTERHSCPAVLFGGSYGGMEAAWHRLKYPHLSVGAIAASAPVDLYPGEGKAEAFWQATLNTFTKFGSDECGSWIAAAAQALNQSTDLGLLSSSFKTCTPLSTHTDGDAVARLLSYVQGALSTLAMVDYPEASSFVTPMPASPVRVACNLVGAPPANPTNAWLFNSLNVAQNVFLNWTGLLPCHNISAELLLGKHGLPARPQQPHQTQARALSNGRAVSAALGDITRPWNYMACSSLILEPLTSDGNGFFVPFDSQIPDVERACRVWFEGIQPRPSWMPAAYGNGIQLAQSLRNVFFSDGEKDPWSVGGMPDNSSAYSMDGSVVRVLIAGAAHHEDLRFSERYDSDALVAARKAELEHVKRWIANAKVF